MGIKEGMKSAWSKFKGEGGRTGDAIGSSGEAVKGVKGIDQERKAETYLWPELSDEQIAQRALKIQELEGQPYEIQLDTWKRNFKLAQQKENRATVLVSENDYRSFLRFLEERNQGEDARNLEKIFGTGEPIKEYSKNKFMIKMANKFAYFKTENPLDALIGNIRREKQEQAAGKNETPMTDKAVLERIEKIKEEIKNPDATPKTIGIDNEIPPVKKNKEIPTVTIETQEAKDAIAEMLKAYKTRWSTDTIKEAIKELSKEL